MYPTKPNPATVDRGARQKQELGQGSTAATDSPPNLSTQATPAASILIDRYALHYGSTKTPLALVIPDVLHRGMWRVWHQDRLSDLANLTRCKDAAIIMALRASPQHRENTLHWRIVTCRPPQGSPVARWLAKNDLTEAGGGE